MVGSSSEDNGGGIRLSELDRKPTLDEDEESSNYSDWDGGLSRQRLNSADFDTPDTIACLRVGWLPCIMGVSAFFVLITLVGILIALSLQNKEDPNHSGKGHSSPINNLAQEYWDTIIDVDPIAATYFGSREGLEKLSDMSLSGLEKEYNIYKKLYDRVVDVDTESLDKEDALNAEILATDIRLHQLSPYERKSYLMPVSQLDGPHIELPQLVSVTPFDEFADYSLYITRLRAVPQYIDEIIELMREGVRQGYTMPRMLMEFVPGELAGIYNVDAEDSVFYYPFTTAGEVMSASNANSVQTIGLQVVEDLVLPAFEALHDYVVEQYIPVARTSIGATELPNGVAYYDACVEEETTLTLSAEAIHQIGLDEAARIKVLMDEIIADQAVPGANNISAFSDYLMTLPEWFADTEEEMLAYIRNVAKMADPQLPLLFGKLPRCPYGVTAVPANDAPTAPSAYYMEPSEGCARPGWYYVNTYDLPSRPLFLYTSTTLHETVPGHHLQIAIQEEIEGIPKFRKFLGWNAYNEGWALYSESLGEIMGFYGDPVISFGRYGDEMLRACRLVVDTGMHALGWSHADAVAFMTEHLPMSQLDIVTEVNRYIAWPGQALGYKLGQLSITDLRSEVEECLGSDYSIKDFHDKVLSEGALPLPILAQIIHEEFLYPNNC